MALIGCLQANQILYRKDIDKGSETIVQAASSRIIQAQAATQDTAGTDAQRSKSPVTIDIGGNNINPEQLPDILKPGKQLNIITFPVHIKCIATCNQVPVESFE